MRVLHPVMTCLTTTTATTTKGNAMCICLYKYKWVPTQPPINTGKLKANVNRLDSHCRFNSQIIQLISLNPAYSFLPNSTQTLGPKHPDSVVPMPSQNFFTGHSLLLPLKFQAIRTPRTFSSFCTRNFSIPQPQMLLP